MRSVILAVAASLLAMPVAAQDGSSAADGPSPGTRGSVQTVTVEMRSRDGQPVGTVELTQMANATLLVADLLNLPPGAHGFHIHERGVCEPPDFTSAGGHLDPANAEHGPDRSGGPHAGDLPNVHVDERGRVKVEFLLERVALEPLTVAAEASGTGRPVSLHDSDGAALVIHAEADDYRNQDSAGERIACGVIRR